MQRGDLIAKNVGIMKVRLLLPFVLFQLFPENAVRCQSSFSVGPQMIYVFTARCCFCSRQNRNKEEVVRDSAMGYDRRELTVHGIWDSV